jgi:hypothetical protein
MASITLTSYRYSCAQVAVRALAPRARTGVESVPIETLKVSTDGELNDGVPAAPANRRD